MPLSRDHRIFVENLAREISPRLSEGAGSVPLLDLIYSAADRYIENGEQSKKLASDVINDIIPAHTRPLISLAYGDHHRIRLDVLDLETGSVFVLWVEDDCEKGIQVAAEFPSHTPFGLRFYVEALMAFDANGGENLPTTPDVLEIHSPISDSDLYSSVIDLLIAASDDSEASQDFIGRATGEQWRLRSAEDRLPFIKSYVRLVLDPSGDGASNETTTTSRRSESRCEEDAVVVDPISGRPLHEFIGSVPRIGASITDGELLEEDGVDLAPHQSSIADRLPGDIVIVDPREPDVARVFAERLKAARRARLAARDK